MLRETKHHKGHLYMFVRFESVTEAFEYARYGESECSEGMDFVRNVILPMEGTRWVYNHTFETLEQSLNRCPNYLFDAITKMKTRLEDQIEEPVRKRRKTKHRLEFGDEIDPELEVIKDPTPFSSVKHEPHRKTTVRIAINTAMSANETFDRLLWRGAAAAAVADILTSFGLDVEIVGYHYVVDLSPAIRWSMMETIIKPSDKPMDIGMIATAIADIGFVRLSNHCCTAKLCPDRPNGTLGYPKSLEREQCKQYDLVIDRDIATEHAAVQFILRNLGSLQQRKEGVV